MNFLNLLTEWRNYLIKNCKHINTGKSLFFVAVSLIGGIVLTIIGLILNNTAGRFCTGIGIFSMIVNAIQLFFKKSI